VHSTSEAARTEDMCPEPSTLFYKVSFGEIIYYIFSLDLSIIDLAMHPVLTYDDNVLLDRAFRSFTSLSRAQSSKRQARQYKCTDSILTTLIRRQHHYNGPFC